MPAATKPKAKGKAPARWYKVLERGRSFHGGTLKWSLPTEAGPGDWHAVEGELARCKNGLHLTDEPTRLRPANHARTVACYEAEYEGDTLPACDHELVVRRCRLVRLVPWDAFAPSRALALLTLVWGAEGKAHGKHSWRRLNDAMQAALALAIDAGMAFDEGDIGKFMNRFNGSYWLHIEGAYGRACGDARGSHGPNPSAIAAIEHYLGRRPFLVARTAAPGAPKDRLCVGKRFYWHSDMKKQVWVDVTSFADDQSHLIACSYQRSEDHETGQSERKIDRRFRITHEDLAEYHAAIRAHARGRAKAIEATLDAEAAS